MILFLSLLVRLWSFGAASRAWDTVLSAMCDADSGPGLSSAAFSPFVDRYKALDRPSNCEKITILNVTPLEAEVQFFFEHDLKAETFVLDPPSMRLKAKEKQVGDGQVGQAPAEAARSRFSCLLKALLRFSLRGPG